MTTEEIKILDKHLCKIYDLNSISTPAYADRINKTRKIKNELMAIAQELGKVWEERDDGEGLNRFELMDLQ